MEGRLLTSSVIEDSNVNGNGSDIDPYMEQYATNIF